jgi:hypothetical protein
MRANTWFKSTRSGAAGHCTEVKHEGGRVLVRDSKDNGTGPVLSFTEPEWDAFTAGVKQGEFDL